MNAIRALSWAIVGAGIGDLFGHHPIVVHNIPIDFRQMIQVKLYYPVDQRKRKRWVIRHDHLRRMAYVIEPEDVMKADAMPLGMNKPTIIDVQEIG